MAEAITKAELKKLPIIPYDKIRPFLKTGDLFLALEVTCFLEPFRI